jgi:hypothetical protein
MKSKAGIAKIFEILYKGVPLTHKTTHEIAPHNQNGAQ